jgi:hypothetical protein
LASTNFPLFISRANSSSIVSFAVGAEEFLMQRELTYQLPFERLRKLSRAASRKAYPKLWWLTWLWIALVLVALFAILYYSDALDRRFDRAGIPLGALVVWVGTALVFLAGVYVIRRFRISEVKRRASFNATIRMRQDEGGLRFITDEIEYYLKWRGLSQMLLDRDGVIVSHGNLFFLIPDHAFTSPEDRLAFIGDVYDRLGERARSISEKHIGALLTPATPAPT